MNYATVLDTKDNGDIIHSMSDNEIRELIFYFLHVRLKFKNKTEVLSNIHYDDFVNNNLMCLLREYDKSPYKLLNKYYDEFDKYDCRLQTTGKTISGTVQEGNNVIVVNLTKKAVASTGWTANSQTFHQAVAQEFATLLANQRAQAGVGALHQNANAQYVAQAQSNWMAQNDTCSDIGPNSAIWK